MSLVEPTDPDDIAGRLNYACQLGHSAFVEAVVRETGVKNMDMLDAYGSPPLYNAAMKNDNPKLIEYLLDRGASVDLRNADDETALFIAAYNNHMEVAKVLIGRGAKVNGPFGYYGDSPLHVAVRNNFPDMLELLCDKGAQVNSRNKHQETPLFLACKLNRKTLVYMLLVRKASKGLTDRDGKDCMFISSEKKHKEILKMLQSAGPAELVQVKKQMDAAEGKKDAPMERRPTWDEVAFKKELQALGVTEEEAKRRPGPAQPYPVKPRVRKKKDLSKPQPLFDSDEDSDEREERLAKERRENERVMAEFRKRQRQYADPEGGGTSFNPHGCADVRFSRSSRSSAPDVRAGSRGRKPEVAPAAEEAGRSSSRSRQQPAKAPAARRTTSRH